VAKSPIWRRRKTCFDPVLKFIHQSKTAALLCAAIRLGAMSANAIPSRLQSLSEFGMALGLAFQVIDDILDVTQSSETLGKSAGKDLVSEKGDLSVSDRTGGIP